MFGVSIVLPRLLLWYSLRFWHSGNLSSPRAAQHRNGPLEIALLDQEKLAPSNACAPVSAKCQHLANPQRRFKPKLRCCDMTSAMDREIGFALLLQDSIITVYHRAGERKMETQILLVIGETALQPAACLNEALAASCRRSRRADLRACEFRA